MQFSQTRIRILKISIPFLIIAIACIFWGNIIREALLLLLGAAIIAFLLTPIIRLLEKKLKRSHAILLSMLSVCILLLLIVFLLMPLMMRQLASLTALLPDAIQRIRRLAQGIFTRIQDLLPGFHLPDLRLAGMEQNLSGIAKSAAQTISGLAGSIYRIILMVVLSYFLLADREHILLRLELMVPSPWRRMGVRMGNMLMRELRLYLRGQATIALAVGVLAAIGLGIAGVPGAPLLGIFVGCLNVIPYFGPFLGGIPAIIMALSVGWQTALFALLTLFLVQQIDGLVISPRVMGNITGFSPAVVLVAIFTGGRIGGIGGMLFALPSLMGIRTLYRVFVQRHENN